MPDKKAEEVKPRTVSRGGKVEKKQVTAPDVALPAYTMLRFSKPVEFAINGLNYSTRPAIGKGGVTIHQLQVPYDKAPTALMLVRDAYGDVQFVG